MTTLEQEDRNRENIIKYLKHGVCEVIFEKVDGSERTLNCTLAERFLPVKKDPKKGEPKIERKKNLAVVTVFDVDANSWKSFRVESVKSIRMTEEN